ncbi:hypothetical protein Pmani_036238 [Petrolisthes manimaculis]|uniref:Uncharacterized protein n=1 Tax=Petrolisthes manimaculis TaxID=1843537 RepID=A0AAE1NK42_9EUCA|nr:hypothetical protein Pmani_036238 [Petrolisthes manimaculis]
MSKKGEMGMKGIEMRQDGAGGLALIKEVDAEGKRGLKENQRGLGREEANEKDRWNDEAKEEVVGGKSKQVQPRGGSEEEVSRRKGSRCKEGRKALCWSDGGGGGGGGSSDGGDRDAHPDVRGKLRCVSCFHSLASHRLRGTRGMGRCMGGDFIMESE